MDANTRLPLWKLPYRILNNMAWDNLLGIPLNHYDGTTTRYGCKCFTEFQVATDEITILLPLVFLGSVICRNVFL